MLRQLCLGASDTLHPVMVRGVEGMAIFHHGPHADFATHSATPQPVRRHRMLRPPLLPLLRIEKISFDAPKPPALASRSMLSLPCSLALARPS